MIRSSPATAKRRRAEAVVIRSVRLIVVDRDGYCRIGRLALFGLGGFGACAGDSEWAHLGPSKRFQTRRMNPALRHTTAGTAMLCRGHHRLYDAHVIDLDPLTDRGADGPLRVSRGTRSVEEPS